MKNRRLAAAVLVMMAAALPVACGLQRVNAPEGRGDASLIVLLPDPEGDTTGSAVVSNSSKPASVDLEKARDYTLVGVNLPPTRVREMKESDVRRLFGDVLEALPPAPAHFTLFFRFESDELTDEGRALVPDVLQAMKNRPVPEVFIVGHTDTTGTPVS
ncbi:MAG TPA: hypothetical protein VLD67_14515, partial [Vicinamibacterales bacterium]|nr:hypothetical protein [Vicinamibacterales bacterium]